jgi:hypothetical protein
MSASLLYHAFNIKDVKYNGIVYSGEGVVFKAVWDDSGGRALSGGELESHHGQIKFDGLRISLNSLIIGGCDKVLFSSFFHFSDILHQAHKWHIFNEL